jgi:hypothetical protein
MFYEETLEDRKIAEMLIEETYRRDTALQNIFLSLKQLKSPRLHVT